jgi:hypothetical protein
VSDRPGGGNSESRRPPDRRRGSGQPQRRFKRGPRSRGGLPAAVKGRGQGPIGLALYDGENYELVHPRGVKEAELDYEEGIEIWKAGDPEAARDALRYALSACHDNLWVHVALGQIALLEFRDPALARGHFGYAFELANRAFPRGFTGQLPRDRQNNRPFYSALDGLVQSLEALGRHAECDSLRALGLRLSAGPNDDHGQKAR